MKNSSHEHKLIWNFIFICIIFIFIYVYIFCVLLNYDIPWMVYEKLKTHLWILVNGKQWHWVDFAKALNTKVIEIDPNRLTRPLSNLVEVIDTKFRANLWDFIPPHPTLSIQWPFLFIGLPFFLFRFFRNINCQPVIALAGTALYMTSSGFLSPIVQMSHPAKNMVNFFAILSLATITQLYRVDHGAQEISIKSVRHFWLILIGCLSSTLITFLSDETGLFLFIVLGFVFYPLLFKFKEKAVLLCSFFMLPVIYFIIIHFFLPWLHFVVNHEVIDLTHYRDFPHISSLFFPNWHYLLLNAYLLFSVHPALKWDFAPLSAHPYFIGLQCVYSLIFLSLMGLSVFVIYKKRTLSSRGKQILSGITLLIIFVFFHTFQLSHNVLIWTVFWYGCIFSLIYYVTLTLVLQLIWEEYHGDVFKILLPLIILVFAVHGLLSSTYIVTTFKNQSNDPTDFHYPDIFSGRVNPYQYFDLSKTIQKSKCQYMYTIFYWSQVKHKKVDPKQFSHEIDVCPALVNVDPYFEVDQVYFIIEAAFEFPVGHSYLNDPDYVADWIHQKGEPD